MVDIKEILYGEEYSDKYNMFIEELGKIEKSHLDFFKQRQSKKEPNGHDRLHNHFYIINRYGTITFGFMKESDIPTSIKDECYLLFNKVWGSTK